MSNCKSTVYTINLVESILKKYNIKDLDTLFKEIDGGKIVIDGKQPKIDYLKNTIGENAKYVANLFSSNESEISIAQKELLIAVSDRADVHSEVSSLLNPASPQVLILSQMLSKYFNNSNMDSAQKVEATIALKYILDAMQTEPILAENYNLSEQQQEELTMEGPTVGTARLYPTIGRAIFASKGVMSYGSPVHNAAIAALEGERVVKALEATGIFNIVEGKWNAGKVEGGNNRLVTKNKLTTGQVIKFNSNSEFINKTDRTKLSEEANELVRSLTTLSRLIEPLTEGVPSKSAKKYDKSIQDLQNVAPSFKSVIDSINGFKFTINPIVAPFIKTLATEYKKENKTNPQSVEKFLKTKFKNNTDNGATLKIIFGIDVNKNIDGPIFADSNRGIETSRLTPLVGLIEHYDELVTEKDNNFYFNYFAAVNSRLHIFETLLNAQSDKQFARQILSPTVATEYSNIVDNDNAAHKNIQEYKGLSEADVLVRRVALEFKLPMSQILGNDTSNRELENLIKSLQNEKNNTDKSAYTYNFLTAIANNNYKVFSTNVDGVTTNPWQILKLASVIMDIRQSVEDGKIVKPITSAYMSEIDATASGLLIKLLQNAHLPAVQDLIRRLGYHEAALTIANELKDSYQIAVDKLTELLQTIDTDVKVESGMITSQDTRAVQTKKLLNILNIGIRDLIKMPSVTFIYGQSPENNKIQFGKDSTDILLKLPLDKLNEAISVFLSPKDKLQYDFSELSIKEAKELRNKLVNSIAATSGDFLVTDVLTEVYTNALFREQDDDIVAIYDIIKTLNGNVDIVSPYSSMANMDAKNKTDDYKKDKITLTKKKENLHKVKVNGKELEIIVNIKSYNSTSAKVVPIHAIDAAVLARTIHRLKTELGREFNDNEVMMLIHDGVYVNSNTASLFSQIYEEELVKVNQNYSILDEMLNTFDEAVSQIQKSNLENTITEKELLTASQYSKLLEIRERNKINKENKKAFYESLPKEDRYLNYSFKTDLKKADSINSVAIEDTSKNSNEPTIKDRDTDIKQSEYSSTLSPEENRLINNEDVIKLSKAVEEHDYVVFDIESYFEKDKSPSANSIPNEVYAVKYLPDGTEEAFHGIFISTDKKFMETNDQLISAKNTNDGTFNMFNTSVKLEELATNLESNVSKYKTAEDLKNAFKEFTSSSSTIFTFNGDNFDNKVMFGINGTDKSIDVRTVLTNLKSQTLSPSQKNSGKLQQYYEIFSNSKDNKNAISHTAKGDVNMLDAIIKGLNSQHKAAISTRQTMSSINKIVPEPMLNKAKEIIKNSCS